MYGRRKLGFLLRPVVFLIEKEGLCQHPLLANWHYNPFKTWEHDRIFKLLLKQEGHCLHWNAKLFVDGFALHASLVAGTVESSPH